MNSVCKFTEIGLFHRYFSAILKNTYAFTNRLSLNYGINLIYNF